ncbi:lipid-A-disaccharide synthase [Myxococcota bacterium]|nr:lipid-A-disaccharide synthase [Myxococcota bacterium]MCZ7618596.1 lipid-A-disaccharide synthase [Myxococcota bacterium]
MRVLVSAGDASGDGHAADVVRALAARRPGTRFVGLGGSALEAAGVEIRVPLRDVAIGGLVEVLGHVPRVFRAWRTLEAIARDETPDLALLVDAPDLHLPLARRLRRAGVPVLYYVSPQVWAWRSRRIGTIAARADRLAVIFPFEVDVFAGTGLRVDFVGHPLVDRLSAVRARWQRETARAALGLPADRPVLVLLPGSRRNEVRRMLPLHLAIAARLRARQPGLVTVLALAPTVSAADVEPLPRGVDVRVVEGRGYPAMVAADLALTKPGTTTLELCLLGTPFAVAGRAHPVSAAVMRRLVQLPSWTLPNLLAGAPVVPEFLQRQARPERVAAALEELLAGPARALQLERLAGVSRRLGPGGAAERTAQIAEEMMRGRVAA